MAAPVYLFTGAEFGARNDKVASVKAALRKRFGSSDEFLMYASDVRIVEVVAQLRSESLFVPATCIVLREAELIKKKEDIELIADWVQSVTPGARNKQPKESSVLILVSDENSVDAKLEKIIPKENRKNFWEMYENDKEAWLRDFFRREGLGISADACAAVLDLVENNTEALRTECGRFALCFPKGHTVSAEDVERMLAHNREESAFTLFDTMADVSEGQPKRLENSLLVLQKILLTKNASSVMVLAGLASCFRRLGAWHSLHAGGGYPDEAQLRAGGFAGKKARAQYAKAARLWSFGQTAAILALISEADMAIRTVGSAVQTTELSLLLYEIIMKNGVRCADYEAGW